MYILYKSKYVYQQLLFVDAGRPPMLPLIRLVAYYHVERQAINPIKFGQKYSDKIANPEDLLVLRAFKIRERSRGANIQLDDEIEEVRLYL